MLYLAFAAGLVALFFGGDWLVRGAVGVARRFRVPPMVIGLTIVGFGTSMPELLVSVEAALDGVPEIAIGNVIGSNIANVLLILGAAAVIFPVHAPLAPMRPMTRPIRLGSGRAAETRTTRRSLLGVLSPTWKEASARARA